MSRWVVGAVFQVRTHQLMAHILAQHFDHNKPHRRRLQVVRIELDSSVHEFGRDGQWWLR